LICTGLQNQNQKHGNIRHPDNPQLSSILDITLHSLLISLLFMSPLFTCLNL